MNFENTFIRIKDAEHFKQVQQMLFKEGIEWSSGGTWVMNTEKPFLFVDECNYLLHGTYVPLEPKYQEIEVVLKPTFDFAPQKMTQDEIEEALGYKIQIVKEK